MKQAVAKGRVHARDDVRQKFVRTASSSMAGLDIKDLRFDLRLHECGLPSGKLQNNVSQVQAPSLPICADLPKSAHSHH